MSKNNDSCPAKKTSIGGQALIEGIMMRGPQKTAMAVRDIEGNIVVEKWDTETTAKNKFFKLPVIRGVFSYIDSMVFGYKCLMRSAEISGLEEAEEEMRREKEAKKAEKAKKKVKNTEPCECKDSDEHSEIVEMSEITEAAETAEDAETAEVRDMAEAADMVEATVNAEASEVTENVENIENAENVEKTDAAKSDNASRSEDKKEQSAFSTGIMVLSVVLGLGLGIFLFFAVPSFIFDLFAKLVPSVAENRWVRSIFEGVIKILILVGYMSLVSLMEDIRRTFMFHGAEHKTIFCYEHGLELTVENVRMQRRFHPRCGTSFLVIMILVNIFISFFIPPTIHTALRIAIKLLTLPLVVGVGYELIKLAGRRDNLFTRIISAPGVWLQHITTKEPDDSMIECAITALKEVIPEDNSDNW